MDVPTAARIELWTTVALQIVLIVFAIRVYRVWRTRPLHLLMWACLAYAFSPLAWDMFYMVRGFLRYPMLAARKPEVLEWMGHSDRTFQILFMLLMIYSFYCFRQERRSAAKPAIQPGDAA